MMLTLLCLAMLSLSAAHEDCILYVRPEIMAYQRWRRVDVCLEYYNYKKTCSGQEAAAAY